MTLHIYDRIDGLSELRKMHLAFMSKKKYYRMEEAQLPLPSKAVSDRESLTPLSWSEANTPTEADAKNGLPKPTVK